MSRFPLWARQLRPHFALLGLLGVFILLAAYYSVTIPIFESPDEVWHYNFIRDVAVNRGLPLVNPQIKQSFAHEGLQPPLYYVFGAFLVGWMDPHDLEKSPAPNPYVLIGQPAYATNDNRNAFLHTTEEAFPYHGASLAVHILRLYSILLAACTIVFTYLLAIELTPRHLPGGPASSPHGRAVRNLRSGELGWFRQPNPPDTSLPLPASGEGAGGGDATVPWLSAAFVAFLPQFLFISSVISNDNMATMLSSAALWLIVRLVNRGANWKRGLFLGLVVGAAMLAKLSVGALAPLVILALALLSWRSGEWLKGIQTALVFSAVVALVAGWWYLRNIVLYGEPLPFTPLAALVGARSTPLDLLRWFSSEGEGLRLSAWGVFGWFNVLAASWFYLFYDVLAVLGLAGLVVEVARRRLGLSLGPVMLAIWIGVCIFALWSYSSRIVSTQGRLLFPALSAWAVLWAWGLSALAPVRFQSMLAGAFGIVLFIPALITPSAFIAPAYAPTILRDETLAPNATRLERRFENGVEWLGASVDRAAARAGDALTVTIFQRIPAAAARPAIFVHLVNSADVIVAQRDSLIASGNLLPSAGPVLIADSFRISIPVGVPAPDTWRIESGMYDPATGKRFLAVDADGLSPSDAITLTSVTGQPPAPGAFNYDFDVRLRLVGATFDRASVAPGGMLRLGLTWSGASAETNRYHVFAHALGENDHIWAATDQAIGGETTTLDLHFDTATPAGVYPLEVGVYPAPDGDRLAIFNAQGQDEGDHLFLGPVRVTR